MFDQPSGNLCPLNLFHSGRWLSAGIAYGRGEYACSIHPAATRRLLHQVQQERREQQGKYFRLSGGDPGCFYAGSRKPAAGDWQPTEN